LDFSTFLTASSLPSRFSVFGSVLFRGDDDAGFVVLQDGVTIWEHVAGAQHAVFVTSFTPYFGTGYSELWSLRAHYIDVEDH